MTVRVRVLIADDHPMVRSGLRQMLDAGDDFEVVADAATGTEALRTAGRLRPDVVLMDLRMPDLDGVTATAEIRRRYPEVHVLVVTTYDTDADIYAAIDAGATGYLLKDVGRPSLRRPSRYPVRTSPGRCHAIGVILDGHAAGRGDPARGSRFHNAVRYVDSHPEAVVVVYSSDDGINILPPLRPRVARGVVDEAVRLFVDAVEAKPSRLAPVAELRDKVVELSFYLSEDHCHTVNEATSKLRDMRAERSAYLLDMADLHPNSEMDQSYWSLE